jgi:two-component SAPR family response regulator
MFIVSDTDDYGLEGFRLRALDYLIKPVTPLRIQEAVRRIGINCWQEAQYPK